MGKINSIYQYFLSISTKKFLGIIILAQILLHLPIAPLPPVGQHTWKQVAGLSQARNYYEEKASFMKPRMDIRPTQSYDGTIYKEFPLLYWVMGKSYSITGFHHINSRLIMLFAGIMLILGSYKLSKAFQLSENISRAVVFFLSCAPYFFYYSITVMPNMPALTWFVWGLALIIPKIREEKWDWKYGLGIACIIIGTLSKATYLFFGLTIAHLFIAQFLKSKKSSVLLIGGISGILILIVNFYFFKHAGELRELAPKEIGQYTTLGVSSHFPTAAKAWLIFKRSATQWFLELYVNTVAVPFFLIGIYVGFKRKLWKSEVGSFWLTWGLSFLLFWGLFFEHTENDSYYFTPMLIFAAFVSAHGLKFFVRSKKIPILVFLLLVCTPMVMIGRVGHRWIWAKQVPTELLSDKNNQQIQSVIPKKDRVLIIGDSTPIVYLYYIERKGLAVPQSLSPTQLKHHQKNGFKWIVADEKIHNATTRSYLKLTTKVGKFSVFQIIPQKKGLN
jgi:hypothetical protein